MLKHLQSKFYDLEIAIKKLESKFTLILDLLPNILKGG